MIGCIINNIIISLIDVLDFMFELNWSKFQRRVKDEQFFERFT